MKESLEKFIDNHIEIIKDRGVLIYPEDIVNAKNEIKSLYKARHMSRREIIKKLNDMFGCEKYGMSELDYELTGKDEFKFISIPNNESYDYNEDNE